MDYYLESVNLQVKSTKVRKASSIDDLIGYKNSGYGYETGYYDIDLIVNLKVEDFEKFSYSLLSDWDFIYEVSEETNKPFLVVIEGENLVSEDPNYPESVLVFSEGYGYARYSGIVERIEEK